MTLVKLVNQLFDLAVDGKFNSIKFSKNHLRRYIETMMVESPADDIIMVIALPDGDWNFSIHKWVERGHFMFDYTIPETREQEKKLIDNFYN